MSRAMTVPELLSAYARWGVDVVEVKRGGRLARDHYRPGAYGDMHGQAVHHTGPWSTVGGIVALLWDGRTDLPGPLATDGIAPDGTVYLVAGGRANHAGKGSAAVYAALVADRTPPAPGPDDVDGNATLYGDEIINAGDGAQLYPNAQVEAVVRVNAARAEHHGWTGASVIRHAEWTTRKIDTRGRSVAGDTLDGAFWRREVTRALELGPDAYNYPEVPDMQLAELKTAIANDPKLRAELAEAVLGGRINIEPALAAELGYGSTSYAAADLIRGADAQARRAQRAVADLEQLVRSGFAALGVPATKLPK